MAADVAATFWSLNTALSIDASATGTDFTALTRVQEDTIDISWSAAWPAGGGRDDGLAVTLRYARSLALAGVRQSGGPFTAETADFFRLLADQSYFLLGLPLLEILLDDTEKMLDAWDGVDEAAWKPSLSVSVERRSGSRLADLFVPATAELSVSRVLEKRSDLSENEILIRPRVGTRALNLFGRLGSHPVMPFYRTDEFNIALSSAFSGSGVADLSLSELTFELYADILGFKDQSLTLVNVFTLGSEAASATDGLQATFDWTTRPAGGVRLPYVPEPIAAHRVLRAPGKPRSRPAVRRQLRRIRSRCSSAMPRASCIPTAARSKPASRPDSISNRCPGHSRTGSRSRQASRQSCLFKSCMLFSSLSGSILGELARRRS